MSDDKNVPVQWTQREVRFRVEVPGKGHSSPIVVGRRLFLTTATDEERLVLCFDAVGGKPLWSRSVAGGLGKIHHKSSLASSTPCSDGERLFCSFWDGKRVSLHAYDLTGNALWKHDLGPFASQHGPGFSPIVVAGQVIVNVDQDGAARLSAISARTGKLVWQSRREAFRACYSTPFVQGPGRDPQLIVASTAGVSSHDPAREGKVLWSYTWEFATKPLRTVASPVAVDGLIIACAGDGDGSRDMIAVRPGPKVGDTPALVWHKDRGTPYVPTLVAHAGHLFGVTDAGDALCLAVASGKERWRKRLAGPTSASPLLIDGKVYVIDERGVARVFAADPTGLRLLGKSAVGEPVFATPAVADDRLYVRGEKHLICVAKGGNAR